MTASGVMRKLYAWRGAQHDRINMNGISIDAQMTGSQVEVILGTV